MIDKTQNLELQEIQVKWITQDSDLKKVNSETVNTVSQEEENKHGHIEINLQPWVLT